jgi:hypothetical protein
MTTNKYYIDSSHFVFIDDYKQGEIEYTNSYSLNAFIEAENVTEAIKKYFNTVLYFSFDIKNKHIDEQGDLHYSNLVNNENEEATHEQIELWKQGKETLYSNNTYLSIHQLNKISIHD